MKWQSLRALTLLLVVLEPELATPPSTPGDRRAPAQRGDPVRDNRFQRWLEAIDR